MTVTWPHMGLETTEPTPMPKMPQTVLSVAVRGGLIVLTIKDAAIAIPKRDARKLAAAINKAAL